MVLARTVLLGSLALTLCAQAPVPLKSGLYAIFNTAKGSFTAELYEKYAPVSVKNFIELAQGVKSWLDPQTGEMVKRRLYDNITFHRVIPGVMIQSGDPTGTGRHHCGWRLPDETLPGLTFNAPGQLAVANSGQPDSGGCQFFVTDGPMSEWNGKYTIFGRIVRGMDVVNAIGRGPVHGDKPDDPVVLNSVTIERIRPVPKAK